MRRPRSTTDIALWTAQVFWGVFFSITGFGKVLCYDTAVWQEVLEDGLPWFSAVPQGLFSLYRSLRVSWRRGLDLARDDRSQT
jgi:hypothetical protein